MFAYLLRQYLWINPKVHSENWRIQSLLEELATESHDVQFLTVILSGSWKPINQFGNCLYKKEEFEYSHSLIILQHLEAATPHPLINIIMLLLSSVLSNIVVKKPWQHRKHFGNARNRTWDSRVVSANATSLLCRPPVPAFLESINPTIDQLKTRWVRHRPVLCHRCFQVCWLNLLSIGVLRKDFYDGSRLPPFKKFAISQKKIPHLKTREAPNENLTKKSFRRNFFSFNFWSHARGHFLQVWWL